jgi:hypothetical protein
MGRFLVCGLTTSLVLLANSALADQECRFTRQARTLLLQGDCTTSSTISIPDGFTLDGRGHRITAVDPAGDHFRGAIVRNAGSWAGVRDLRLRAVGLADQCDAVEGGLRGILLEDASGRIERTEVSDVNQGPSGCQEGQGIEVRNFGALRRRVTIQNNVVERYQKTGIVVLGKVHATVRHNVVTGLGPVSHIAQNGIQLGWGATGIVRANAVSDNSFSGVGTVAVGILVVGGPGHACQQPQCDFTRRSRVLENVVVDNDVGIALDNREQGGVPAFEPTNNSVVSSTVASATLTNGSAVQVGILGIGNRDRIEKNAISGDGYDPRANPGAVVQPLLAEPPYATAPEVRDNQLPL